MAFDFKMRLIGYYTGPKQVMKPEESFVEESKELARKFEKTITYLHDDPQVDDSIKAVIDARTVFVFKNEDGKLYAYFTTEKTARITSVTYNRTFINQIPYKYKGWFIPGQKILLSANNAEDRGTSNVISVHRGKSGVREKSNANVLGVESRLTVRRNISEDEKLIRKNWKLKDNYFIGFIDVNEEEGRYRVTDIRRSDFSKITAKVQRGDKEYAFTISGKSDFLTIEQPRKYYKFSWVLRSLDPTPIFYIDTKQPVEIFEPKDIVQCIHDDILDYPGSASQIIVKTLDTLKNQLTASGKEIFIYELLQNANDYPCKDRDGNKIPVSVEFRLTENYLIFQHSGAYFSPRNIAAICNINDKEKTDNTEAIGYKGIGFKTVFLDNNYVFLRTGDFTFRFDWADSKDILDIPWQILPIWTSTNQLDTEVRDALDSVNPKFFKVQFALRPTKKSTLYAGANNYRELFNKVFETERVLLFIPYIQSVKFSCIGQEPIVRSKESDKWCISDLTPADISPETRESINRSIKEGDTKIPEKYRDFYKTTVKFACEREDRILKPVSDTCLYCYLPAKKARLGLPFLLNTDMIPTGPRDDIEELDVNFEICRIAGYKLVEWLQQLAGSAQYDYDSIFSLIPSFEDVTNYETFIENLRDGFTEAIEEVEFIPVLEDGNVELKNINSVIFDSTGLSLTGIMSDDEIVSFANGHGWDREDDEFFAHPELRSKPYFKEFIEEYHADGMEFDIDSLKGMFANINFLNWFKVPQNNANYLNFLIESELLQSFVDDGKTIFLGEDGCLYSAEDIYEDIDIYLSDLSCFVDDFLPHLSLEVRNFFKDNEKWASQTKGIFKEFVADDFVSEIMDNSYGQELLERLDNSVKFFHFLAQCNVSIDGIKNLSFVNSCGEVIADFDRLVFFKSDDGLKLKAKSWINDEWVDFIHPNYLAEDCELVDKYLRTVLGVLDYSDDVIVNSIIKSAEYVSDINANFENSSDSISFVKFVFANASCFEDDDLLKYYLYYINGEGESVNGVADSDSFFYSDLYEELSTKEWSDSGWLYSLDEAYFEGLSNDEIKTLKSFITRVFNVRELSVKNFVKDILVAKTKELESNIKSKDCNIEFWRWVKSECPDEIKKFKSLPLIAYDKDGDEDFYCIDDNSIYLSDALQPDNQYIESLVKKYDEDALFVSAEYLESKQATTRKEWREFFAALGVRIEQNELVFDHIIPNLSKIEDPAVPSMLAQAREFFSDKGVELAHLRSLRLQTRDGSYRTIYQCLFVNCKDGMEPFANIVLPNECILSQYSSEARRLIADLASELKVSVIQNSQTWVSLKLEEYLKLQNQGAITREVHMQTVLEILRMKDEARKDHLENIRKIKLLSRDDKYIDQAKLTLGAEYNIMCNFEANGISSDRLVYISQDYHELDCTNIDKQIKDVFNCHYRFKAEDVDLLNNQTFSLFFWGTFLAAKNAPISRIEEFIEQGHFSGKKCVPTMSGVVKSAEELYDPESLKEYKKLVDDWGRKFPYDSFTPEVNSVLLKLNFRDSLGFDDALYALSNTEDKDKRKSILKWMAAEYDEHDSDQTGAIEAYLDSDKCVWRNRKKAKFPLSQLYALDIGENSRLLEQYFKLHPSIISDSYFYYDPEVFYTECAMLKTPIITWEEMVLTPKLADKNEAALKDIFRNYLLFVAAIEHPDNWSESFNVLCEKFDALSFSRCISISLSYSKDDSIAQNSKKFYHDEDSSIFYYVNQWHDRSVFTDMVDELRAVIESDLDRDLFLQIFEPKETLEELDAFANEHCVDLADDVEFRKILERQLGVIMSIQDYEEDIAEPELKEVERASTSIPESITCYDNEDENEGETENDNEVTMVSDAQDQSSGNVAVDTPINVEPKTETKVVLDLGKPTTILSPYIEEESIEDGAQENEDEECQENAFETMHESYAETGSDSSSREHVTKESDPNKLHGGYRGEWKPAAPSHPAVRQRRNYAGYSPDKFKERQFDAGEQEPITLSESEPQKHEIEFLNNLFGRALNINTIKDENYIVRMRFLNSLRENGFEVDLDERSFIENDSKEIVTTNGKYVHRCSARGGILYISPSVWNRLREGRWVICFYSGKLADQFVYVRNQDELMDLIDKDAVVVQVTGNNKRELIDRLYEDGFTKNMQGNIYTLIRTIKVEGEVTPFDENIADYYSDDENVNADLL